MTVVIFGTLEIPDVAALATCLRNRGVTVVALDYMSIVMLVLLTKPVAVVIVHELRAPADWKTVRDRLAQLRPTTKILFVPQGDSRTPEELASEAMRT